MRIIRLTSPARLSVEADADSEELATLPMGEFVQAIGEVDGERHEWLLVRTSNQSQVNSMGEDPLTYVDGWVQWASFDVAPHQLGDRVAACVDVPEHPVLGLIEKLPPFKSEGKAGLPRWMHASVCEYHVGKVQSVVQGGRLLIQRPSGAVPERIATTPDLLLVSRARFKKACFSGFIGFIGATAIGVVLHLSAWASGRDMNRGVMAWPQLVGWLTISTIFLSPLSVVPCFVFTNSQASTAAVVCWIDLMLYADLFTE